LRAMPESPQRAEINRRKRNEQFLNSLSKLVGYSALVAIVATVFYVSIQKWLESSRYDKAYLESIYNGDSYSSGSGTWSGIKESQPALFSPNGRVPVPPKILAIDPSLKEEGGPAASEQEHERIAASDYARDHLSYLARGFYARSLRLFFETLPRERTLVLILEEMRRDPARALAGVHRFLGLDPGRARLPDKLEHNANWTTEPRFPSAPGLVRLLEHGWGRLSGGLVRRLTRDTERRRTWRNRANWPFRKTVAGRAMPAALKARLRDHYAAANRELAEMLERDLQDWNQ